jgi:hypothetical protein
MAMDEQTGRFLGYAISAVVITVVLGLRFWSMAKVRPLKLNRLWVLPAIYAVFAGYIFSLFPPVPRGWLYALVGLMMGVAMGWQRGKLMDIAYDPETQSLTQKASPAAMIFIAMLVLVRMGSRMFIGDDSVDNGLHGNTLLITDTLIALALGFLTAQRIEMYLRAKRLVGASMQP